MTWNRTLEHIGEKGLQTLHGNPIVEAMFDCALDLDFYEDCIYGKYNMVRFSLGATQAKKFLELVHKNLFGAMHFLSLGKYVYYISFIDDF